MINKKILLTICSLIMILPQVSVATRHALLVGINDYSKKPLFGPVNDVTAIKAALISHWQFKTRHITTLLNEQATKRNILDAINALIKQSQSGDEVFIYLSGHGTSAGDQSFRPVLPTTSGAFIPFDVEQAKTPEAVFQRLVVGRVDLQPLLTQLDQGGRHVFVAIDACYSGNAVRGSARALADRLPTRNMPFADLIDRGGSFAGELDLDKMLKQKWTNQATDSYPYKNVYYIAASGEYEPAQDIPPTKLKLYPTLDGKPHGAFSDTLLRVLAKDINADRDNNGQISYGELSTTLRRQMRSRGFNHTPRGLPTLADDTTLLNNKPMFGSVSAQANNQLSSQTRLPLASAEHHQKPLRVKTDPSLKRLIPALNSHSLLNHDATNYDLELRVQAADVLFISRSGDVILRLHRPSDDNLINTLTLQILAARMANPTTPQHFSLAIELDQADKASTLAKGDKVGFSITSQLDAYLLIINIDASGKVNVIYPRDRVELTPIKAQQNLQLIDLTTVTPPFGRELVMAYAFKNFDKTLATLRTNYTFSLDSGLAKQMLKMIENQKTTMAKTSLALFTVDQ